MPLINLANYQQLAAINVLSDPGHIAGPIIIPNAVQVILDWTTASGRGAKNILYGSVGGSFTPTATIADAILTALTTGASWTAFAALISSSTALAHVILRDVRSANQPLVSSTQAAHPGTNASISLPNEVALVVTLRTALTGQANRGRMYLPGYGSDQNTAGNVVVAGAVTATQNWINNNFFAALSGQGLTWSLGHPARAAYTGSTGAQHPARVASLVPITLGLVRDNHWDSQRRRGLK